MADNNFKVLCTDTAGLGFYTKGKIYEVNDGVFTYDDGDIEPCEDFDDFISRRDGKFMRLPDYTIVNSRNKPLSEHSLKEISEELLRRCSDDEYEAIWEA